MTKAFVFLRSQKNPIYSFLKQNLERNKRFLSALKIFGRNYRWITRGFRSHFPCFERKRTQGCADFAWKFVCGYKRNGFRSHFPRFERKRKWAAHPSSKRFTGSAHHCSRRYFTEKGGVHSDDEPSWEREFPLSRGCGNVNKLVAFICRLVGGGGGALTDLMLLLPG